MRSVNVLFIEDQKSTSLFYTALIKSIRGYTWNVISVETIAIALTTLEMSRFDLILLDLQLPDASGDCGLKRILEKCDATPIIVLTVDDDEVLRKHIMTEGAFDYLIKDGVRDADFRVAVRAALGVKNQETDAEIEEARREDRDRPMSVTEWRLWIRDCFTPHSDDDKRHHAMVAKLNVAVFGDGNGDKGIRGDVRQLMAASVRIETWLDGIRRLWIIVVALAGAVAGVLVTFKTMGWI